MQNMKLSEFAQKNSYRFLTPSFCLTRAKLLKSPSSFTSTGGSDENFAAAENRKLGISSCAAAANVIQKNLGASSDSIPRRHPVCLASQNKKAETNVTLMTDTTRRYRILARLNPTPHGHDDEERAHDQSASWLSMKRWRTSRWAARSRTKCWRDGCSRSSASGMGGWQRGRYWRLLKSRCRWSTTSQKMYRRRMRRRKSSPKNCRYDGSNETRTSRVSIMSQRRNKKNDRPCKRLATTCLWSEVCHAKCIPSWKKNQTKPLRKCCSFYNDSWEDIYNLILISVEFLNLLISLLYLWMKQCLILAEEQRSKKRQKSSNQTQELRPKEISAQWLRIKPKLEDKMSDSNIYCNTEGKQWKNPVQAEIRQ